MRSKAERAARPLRGRSEGLGYVPTSSFHGSRPFGLREKWHLYYKCIACTVYRENIGAKPEKSGDAKLQGL